MLLRGINPFIIGLLLKWPILITAQAVEPSPKWSKKQIAVAEVYFDCVADANSNPVLADSVWDKLSARMKIMDRYLEKDSPHKRRLNCWEVMMCGREPGGENCTEDGVCPAAADQSFDGINSGKCGGRICWAVAGTFCDGCAQGSFVDKRPSCLSCDFYQKEQNGRWY